MHKFNIVDLEKIPFFGERIIKASTQLPNARAGDIESIMPPLLVPLAPERNYFLFGEVRKYGILYYTNR